MARKPRRSRTRASTTAPVAEALVVPSDVVPADISGEGQNDDLGEPVTSVVLARYLDLTPARISVLASEGVMPRNRDGSYPKDACRVAYIRSLRRAASNRVRVVNNGDSLRDAKVLKMQMELQEKQGILVNVNDVTALISEVFGKMRNELAGLGASVTRDLQLRAAIEEKVNDAVDRARSALEASADDGFSDDEGTVEDEEAAA